MAQDREQLEALLKFIDGLCKEPGNEWFVERLHPEHNSTQYISAETKNLLHNFIDNTHRECNHERMTKTSCSKCTNRQHMSDSTPCDDKIDYIFEYCVERIVRKQADEFYQNFPIKEIIPTLQDDYVRMEMSRRKDNFWDFCLALYQQIEYMTNEICRNNKMNKIFKGIQNKVVFRTKDRENVYVANYVLIGDAEKKLDKNIKELPAVDKMRVVTYILTMEKKYFNYKEFCDNLSQIYCCRCKNHRGGEQTDYQRKIICGIMPVKTFYYFKFIGVLTQYTEYIVNNYNNILLQYAEAVISSKLQSAVFVKLERGEIQQIPMELLKSVMDKNVNDSVIVKFDSMGIIIDVF